MKNSTRKRAAGGPWSRLEARAGKELLNVVIETPRSCRNKFKYDPKLGLFLLGSVLPTGASFPYDFGFVPGTEAPDGDPLDVLILMDEPAFTGCLVVCRLIGVLEAEQTEGGQTVRNDRLIAVAKDAHNYADLQHVSDINENLLKELEHFFVSYNQSRGKEFKLLNVAGPRKAWKLVDKLQTRE